METRENGGERILGEGRDGAREIKKGRGERRTEMEKDIRYEREQAREGQSEGRIKERREKEAKGR